MTQSRDQNLSSHSELLARAKILTLRQKFNRANADVRRRKKIPQAEVYTSRATLQNRENKRMQGLVSLKLWVKNKIIVFATEADFELYCNLHNSQRKVTLEASSTTTLS